MSLKSNIIKCMATNIFQIAIDGPVGSGKSTVTRLVAERLHFLYVDTGAMYRVVALACLRAHMAHPILESDVVHLLQTTRITLKPPSEEETDGRLISVFLNDEDISWLIRTHEVNSLVPTIAAMSEVRKILVNMQQEISKQQSVVMEGRDITYRVLPDADLKIYLTADPAERAKRRHAQLQSKGEDIPLATVLTDLNRRDSADMNRAADPLIIADGVWVLDTTGMSIDQVVDAICERVPQEKRL